MPLKWKIYYACSWVLLLWSILSLGVILYDFIIFKEYTTNSNGLVLVPLMVVMMAILIFESIFGIRLVYHLKNGSNLSKREKKQSNIINILATVLSVMFCLTVAYRIPVMLNQMYYRQIAANIFSTIAILSAVYLCLMHKKLKTAINQQYFNTIETIGEDIIENP